MKETLEAVLGRLARPAVIALLDADAVSVTRIDSLGPATIVATDDTVLDMDAQQYAADRGHASPPPPAPAHRSTR